MKWLSGVVLLTLALWVALFLFQHKNSEMPGKAATASEVLTDSGAALAARPIADDRLLPLSQPKSPALIAQYEDSHHEAGVEIALDPIFDLLEEENFGAAELALSVSERESQRVAAESLRGLCSPSRANVDQSVRERLRGNSLPNTPRAIESIRWLVDRLEKPCQTLSPNPRRLDVKRIIELSVIKNVENDALILFGEGNTRPDVLDLGLRNLLSKTRDPGTLRAIAHQAWALGGWSFGKQYVLRTSSNPPHGTLNLRMTQRIALDLYACDTSRLCGPEQFDALVLCDEFFVCKSGISSFEAWSLVASPQIMEAALLMLSDLRAGKFGN